MATRSSRSRKLAQGNDLNGILFEPASDWSPRAYFPDIRGARWIGVDSEVRDPNLKERGPGFIRRDGYPVGYSIATSDGFSGYYPIAHLAGGNLEKPLVIQWLQDMLGDPRAEKIFCNAIYDLGWAHTLGIEVKGKIHDISSAEALIDEERFEGYDLSSIATKYLGKGKDEELLRRAATEFGIDPKRDMWKLHSRYVGPYATADAVKTLKAFEVQQVEIDRQGLRKVYELEMALIPILLQMRLQGVRVDLEAADKLRMRLKSDYDNLTYRVLMEQGTHLNPWSQDQIAPICDKLKIQYPRTATGSPSFVKDFLAASDQPFLNQVRELRRLDRLRGTFVEELIFGNQIDGRIHAEFHPLRGDEYGVRGGRFSCSNPNLQQVTARDEEFAPLVRGMFIPEAGKKWAKLDYSQQEPRILVHYAYICKLREAEAARNAWRDNPLMDYYDFLAKAANIKRRSAKDLTLGRFYGMGKAKLASKLNCSEMEAEELLKQYDDHNPYVRDLSEKCIKQADRKGYIKTIHGRICHFDFWLPADARWGDDTKMVKGEAAARAQWPDKHLIRAHTRKALNRLIQGSAGDMTKVAMLHNYNEYGAVPHLQVHDELDYSAESREDAEELKHGMENCMQLEVPIVAELDYGDTWK